MLKAKKPDADETRTKKLPDMARRFEESLYKRAPSKAAYTDINTLNARVKIIAGESVKKSEAKKAYWQLFEQSVNCLTPERREQFWGLDKKTQTKHFHRWVKRRNDWVRNDMPKYNSGGMTCEGFKGNPWTAKVGDRVVLRDNHDRDGYGWTVVEKKPWPIKDFPDPILILKYDKDGTIITSSSQGLVKEDVWKLYVPHEPNFQPLGHFRASESKALCRLE